MQNIGRSLKTLQLTRVSLATWPSWIQHFPNLTLLQIDESSISSVPDNALDSVANSLVELHLGKISLTSIPIALSQLSVLETLTLEFTDISDITNLPRSSKLSTLTLTYNHLSNSDHVSKSLLPLSDSIEYLHLEGNRLTSIPELSFLTQAILINVDDNIISTYDSGSFPENVFFLGLTMNNFSEIPPSFSRLQRLGVFDISRNVLQELRGASFPPQIRNANFSNNLITELRDDSFPPNSSIMYMVLDNNNIVTVSSHAFDNLPNLFMLSLRSTKLTRLPLAFTFYDRIIYIDLSDNPDLVCTCEEKSLEALLLITPVEVVGKCGNINIRDFFINLSSACPS